VSQRKRKVIEEVFGWLKTVGGLRKVRHRGTSLVDWIVTFASPAYRAVRLRRLLGPHPAWSWAGGGTARPSRERI